MTAFLHGIDIVDLRSFALVANDKDALLDIFTPGELSKIPDDARRLQSLAGRFAIKEAILKALKIGLPDGTGFVDIEVVTDQAGAPDVELKNYPLKVSLEIGINHWLVSLSHDGEYAVGSVIGVGQ